VARVVVTGASGFLGGALINFLRENNIDCIGITRKKSLDLFTVESYEESPLGNILIHLAEPNNRSDVEKSGTKQELACHETFKVLLKKGYQRVIYASSATLYADSSTTPRKVTDPIEGKDVYTRIKMSSESLALSSGGTVVRMANLYGPGMSTENVVSHILNQAGLDRAITMRSLGPVRDFLWIEDALTAFLAIIEKGASGVFNVGSGRGASIRELVSMVQSIFKNKQDVIELCPLKESSNLILDIELTKKTLGWAPKTILEEGIRKMVAMKIKNHA
jgi:UDP-glucose 4-epimerase